MKVESHPQRQEIIDSILAGKALRNIAATLDPPLHFTSLARFRKDMLKTASAGMHARGADCSAIKDLCADPADQSRVTERLRDDLQQSVQAANDRFDRWIDSAEAQEEVNAITGEVRYNMDHGALARHSRNVLSAIELRAKLAGLLQDGSATVAINIAVAGGSADVEPAAVTIEMLRK
jgi:hypothetical protein